MKLSIDYREKALLQRIPIEPSNLPLGDIVIEKDNKELIIIERKTVNDLVSSICDGRYKEQSFRLNESCVSNHNILYIIEGQLVDCTLTKKTLIASLISLWYHKGFTVYRTTDIDETAE
jgi:ERCC4-type nuclease